MKKITLTICATIIAGLSAFAAPSTPPDRDIEIIREEIHRHELVLAILKEKLTELENEVATDRIRIEIEKDKVLLEGETVTRVELKEKIGLMPSDGSVSILADSATPHKEVTSILDLLKGQGISDVVLSSRNSEPGEGDNSE
ncbi:MAG: hypothetical protein FMJ08_11965 [Halomonas sp.]|nr:hypothetical protein [Halomonas sp.]TVM04612.1 MAG: hypothetical protein FMJ08_11965 [Halomonas sp.]